MRRFLRWAKLISARVWASASSSAFALLQGAGDLGDRLGECFGDLRGGALRFEEIGILEQRAEKAQILRAINLVVGELVGLLDRAVEVGADDVAVEIADDQQRRIEQRFAVAEQLLVGFVEVLLLALVFPGEAALFPHVGKAAFCLVGCFGLEPSSFRSKSSASLTTRFWKQKKSLPVGVGFDGRGLVRAGGRGR